MTRAGDTVIEVLASDYSHVIGRIPDPISVSTTFQWQGVGTGSLTVREEGEVAAQLLQIQTLVVPVTVRTPPYPRWTGRVIWAQSVKKTGSIGQIQASMVDERKWLDRILAAPTPGSPWSSQTTEQDTRTGPIETVVRQYVSANVARMNAVGDDLPIVVTPAPVSDTSPTVTIQARNKTIAEEIGAALKLYNRDVTTTLWLPGDPQVPGLSSLSVPTVVVDVTAGRDRRFVNFKDTTGGLEERSVTVTIPEATEIIVGGPGEGVARVFERYVATDGRVASLGAAGRTEVFLDATDADTSAVRAQRAAEKFDELAGKASVNLVIDDARPFTAGPADDYWTGDLVRASFSGVTAEDRITRISLTRNRDGFSISPQFGETRETESADAKIAQTVKQLAQQIASILAGR